MVARSFLARKVAASCFFLFFSSSHETRFSRNKERLLVCEECIASRKSSFFAHATGLFFRAERCSFGSFSALAPYWKKRKSRGRIERKKEDCAEASGNPFVAAVFQAFGKRREKWNEG
jgi:hypothetical protein